MLELEKKAKLFAITYASKDGTSLYDWIPFPKGDTLGKIVLNHNKKCLDAYTKMKWGDQYIRTMAEGIYLVPSHISKIGEWSVSDFSEKNYILIDSTMVGHESDIQKMVKIMPQGKWYYLLFVGAINEMESLAKEFDFGSVVPCGEFLNQAQFEAFLRDNCNSYGQFVWEALKARSIDPTMRIKTNSEVMRGIPNVANNVQGFSNFIDLNEEQKKGLAYRVSQNGYDELTKLIGDLSISIDKGQDLGQKFLNDSKDLSMDYHQRNISTTSEVKYFILMNKTDSKIGIFKGKQPRQAALKAANRGYADIKLRERGTKKVHIFTGKREQVKKPKGAPAWMPAKIWKPNVKKVGVKKLDTLKPTAEKVVVVKRGVEKSARGAKKPGKLSME